MRGRLCCELRTPPRIRANSWRVSLGAWAAPRQRGHLLRRAKMARSQGGAPRPSGDNRSPEGDSDATAERSDELPELRKISADERLQLARAEDDAKYCARKNDNDRICGWLLCFMVDLGSVGGTYLGRARRLSLRKHRWSPDAGAGRGGGQVLPPLDRQKPAKGATRVN